MPMESVYRMVCCVATLHLQLCSVVLRAMATSKPPLMHQISICIEVGRSLFLDGAKHTPIHHAASLVARAWAHPCARHWLLSPINRHVSQIVAKRMLRIY